MLAALSLLALAQGQETSLTFAELEKKKYDAFAALSSFQGRYDVISLPREGVGMKQEVSYLIANGSRRLRVRVNGSDVVQMAFSALQRWAIDYKGRQYQIASGSGAALPPYQVLPCEPNSVNFQVSEAGVRINSDPQPTILSVVKVTEDGRKLTKITAKVSNPASGGEMTAVQWFDEDKWIVRKFEITSEAKGSTLLSLKGFLRDDSYGVTAGPSDFELPQKDVAGFQRVDG